MRESNVAAQGTGGNSSGIRRPPSPDPRLPSSGRIYDLGYQPYTGPREGRGRALAALYRSGLRRVWGIGRPFRAKIAPWGLFVLALLPALVALGIAAFVSERLSPFRYENYYGAIARILLLFSALAAPELLCPDRRQRVLSLYFSRAVARSDYVAARLAALLTALLTVALIPEALLFAGNAFAAADAAAYARDHLDVIPRIVAAGLLVSLYFGAIALAVSSLTTRRVFAAGGFIALMLISTAVVASVHATLDNDLSRYLGLLALSEAPIAATAWIFGAAPAGLARAVDLPLGLWALAAAAYIATAFAVLAGRYGRLAA